MQKSYYAIIPANVRYDKGLTPNAKLLYGEITALCNERGYCWASNSYFSELYSVSIRSISKWINQLIEKGYVTSELIYEDGKKEVKNRHLRIGSGIEEMFNTSGTKVHDPIEEKFHTPIEEKFQDNNTVINNTNNNPYSNEFEQFWIIYPRKVDKKKAYKSFKVAMKNYSFEEILEGTKKYSQQTKGTEKQFIKHPSTFLNNDSFVDGFEESTGQPNLIIKKETKSAITGFWGAEDYE